MIKLSDDLLLESVDRRKAVQEEVAKSYIGKEATVELLMVALLSQGHVLLEGVPGIAKTTLVKAFAQTLGCDFKRIQFTPDLLPADITGGYILNLKENVFELRKGPIFANIILGDEINRAPAKTQSALLEVMQEAQVTVEGHTESMDLPFMVLATQNPIEQEGVYPLPEAQVDRFQIKIALGYPTEPEEQRVLRTYNAPLQTVERVLEPSVIREWIHCADSVFIEEGLQDYIVRIIRFTRDHPEVLLGGSPRAGVALLRGVKSRALLQGRDHVLPDDVRFLVQAVVGHRLVLLPEATMEGVTASAIIDEAIRTLTYAPHAQT